jgi:hypothetical protein
MTEPKDLDLSVTCHAASELPDDVWDRLAERVGELRDSCWMMMDDPKPGAAPPPFGVVTPSMLRKYLKLPDDFEIEATPTGFSIGFPWRHRLGVKVVEEEL